MVIGIFNLFWTLEVNEAEGRETKQGRLPLVVWMAGMLLCRVWIGVSVWGVWLLTDVDVMFCVVGGILRVDF